MWKSKKHIVSMMDFWINGLEKMRIIEDYYEVEFQLKGVRGEDNLNALYDAIDYVYDGIVMNQNCEIIIHGGFAEADFELTEPMLCQENEKIPLKNQVIQDVVFRPYKSAILPGIVRVAGTTKEDMVRVKGCCLYQKCTG